MQPRQSAQDLLMAICKRIHEETMKSLPYSSNKHPVSGFMNNGHFSHPHNLMRSAAHSQKSKSLVKLIIDGEPLDIPAKQFVLQHLNIDISRYPAGPDDDQLMLELNKKILKLTGAEVMFYQLEEMLDEHKLYDKKIRKDGSIVTPKELIEAFAKNLKKFGVGNCSDRVRYNIVAAIEYPIDEAALREVMANAKGMTVEYFALVKGYDHAFTVINRDLNSDPNNPATWGNNAIIIDSWWFLHKDDGEPVFNVAEQVKKHAVGKANGSFNYIMKAAAEGNISNFNDEPYYIGEGHTLRWQENAKAGKVDSNLCDYSDIDATVIASAARQSSL